MFKKRINNTSKFEWIVHLINCDIFRCDILRNIIQLLIFQIQSTNYTDYFGQRIPWVNELHESNELLLIY